MMPSFFAALKSELPLQVVGTINAFSALQAQQAGFRAIYLSGAGVANASHGIPDLGLTSARDVAEEIRRIVDVVDLPLLVDADTGWGTPTNVAYSTRMLQAAGASAMHIEDQVMSKKRCGHRPNKSLISQQDMVDKVKAAVDARKSESFAVVARTDAVAVEGLDYAVERSLAYVDAGANFIFAEALTSLEDIQTFCNEVSVPVIINMTEFGMTPLMDLKDLEESNVSMVLYPLSAFRAMSKAAETVYQTIRNEGTQKSVVKMMQTRDQLYDVLNYHESEKSQDNEG